MITYNTCLFKKLLTSKIKITVTVYYGVQSIVKTKVHDNQRTKVEKG